MKTVIEFKGVKFDVEFDYQPEEPMLMYDRDGGGYPGCAESVDNIYEFRHKGTCFYEFLEDYEEEIIELILESLRNY